MRHTPFLSALLRVTLFTSITTCAHLLLTQWWFHRDIMAPSRLNMHAFDLQVSENYSKGVTHILASRTDKTEFAAQVRPGSR